MDISTIPVSRTLVKSNISQLGPLKEKSVAYSHLLYLIFPTYCKEFYVSHVTQSAFPRNSSPERGTIRKRCSMQKTLYSTHRLNTDLH